MGANITREPLPLRLTRPQPRRADVHGLLASTLALLALGGCITAIMLIVAQPTAARLQSQISALDHSLSAARAEMATLQGTVRSLRAAGLRAEVGRLGARVAGLQRTVHGLQSSSTRSQQQTLALATCLPQLQSELAGLVLRTRATNGTVTRVSLGDAALLSPACESVLGGL